MKWQGRVGSGNIEDRRGMSGGGMAVGGGVGGLVLILLISALTGTNPLDLINTTSPTSDTVAPGEAPANDPQAQFVSVVLKSTEMIWGRLFDENRQTYEAPVLVLFNEAAQSACGLGRTAMGPFYCPGDRKVYLDLSFFRELDERFGAPGDFAQAYVIAHEVGHHVQNLLGEGASARSLVRGTNRENTRSIQTELQADCYAGIWAHSTEQRDLLQAGDVEEGLRAAAAVGDDTLQRETQGRVSPETWTHGSSEQRVGWFKRGYTGGSLEACDTRGESAR